MSNFAFIDGQNLHLGLLEENWKFDYSKFRIYLRENYKIGHAYYFLGYRLKSQTDLYKNLRRAGFKIIFKEHNQHSRAKKKGNVDTDIVFEAMKSLIENKNFNQMVIVSGDGDYKKLVNYLISKDRFRKIIFPNKKYSSSLYKKIGSEKIDYLENIRDLIEYIPKKEKGS